MKSQKREADSRKRGTWTARKGGPDLVPVSHPPRATRAATSHGGVAEPGLAGPDNVQASGRWLG